jgi:hypothetical protein
MPRINQKHEYIKENIRRNNESFNQRYINPYPCIICEEDDEFKFSYKSVKDNYIIGSKIINGRLCRKCIYDQCIDQQAEHQSIGLESEDLLIHMHIQICNRENCRKCDNIWKIFNN